MSGKEIYLYIRKTDYEKIITILRYQERQIRELTRAKDEFLLSEDDKYSLLRQENKNLQTRIQAKKNLQYLMYEKSSQLGQYEHDLKLAQCQIENCKKIIEELGGTAKLEEAFKRLSVEDDADSDGSSVDFEGEDIDGQPQASSVAPSVIGGVSRAAFEGAVREGEAAKKENISLRSKLKVHFIITCS